MRRTWVSIVSAACASTFVACADDGGSSSSDTQTSVTITLGDGDGDGDGDTVGDGDGDGDDTGTPKLDVTGGDGDGDGDGDQCTVDPEGMDAPPPCEDEALPDSFDPDTQWVWGEDLNSIVTPLAANLTDDNGDDSIDLCDVPDIVVVAGATLGDGNIYVLDGETGAEHFMIPTLVGQSVTPALGDIDGDGLVEIVAATNGGLFGGSGDSNVVAFEHDGSLKWMSAVGINHGQGFAIALADIDADGDVEIIADDTVLDHEGTLLWTAPEQSGWTPYDVWHCTATAVADLDGDDAAEIILGQSAYTNTGTPIWNHPGVEPGFPQVADVDDDGEPEILVTNRQGITIMDADGGIVVQNQTPTGDLAPAWFRPATIHDFDGDTLAEAAVSSANHYSVVEPSDMSIVWSADVQDASGWSSGTAFDFLGDGGPEAMYTDEVQLHVLDDMGQPLLNVPRASPTLIEYPIVADIDNDTSAEIVVPSHGAGSPAIQVIPRPGRPLDSGTPHLESAHVPRDQRARRRDHPDGRAPLVGGVEHLPHERADRGRRHLQSRARRLRAALSSTWRRAARP